MGVTLSLNTNKITDKKLKEYLENFYITGGSIPWEFEVQNFFERSKDKEHILILTKDKIGKVQEYVENLLLKAKKNLEDELKILTCIKLQGYENVQNQKGEENSLKYEVGLFKSIFDTLEKEMNISFQKNQDTWEMFDSNLQELLGICELIDKILSKFPNTYKNDETIHSLFDYLLQEIYNIYRLRNLFEYASKYKLEVVYE